MVKLQTNSAQTPVEWTARGSQTCEAGEMCQETLLLVDVGHRSLIVGSKGCTQIRTHESPTVTVHSGPPGMLVASYARFCSSSGCNRADSSSVLLDAIPRPAALIMNPALLLALLGIALMLPRVQALTCQSGTGEAVMNVSGMPLHWTVTNQQVCEDGWGCQDTLLLTENGPHVNLVVSKGCTPEADHEARVTQHRAGPGLSIVSYTHVCRNEDLCNNVPNTLPLWDSLPPTVPGSMRCPVCLSTEGCASATELTCPAGDTHCYNGILLISGGGIATNLRVQGCTSQAGCNLLNNTQKIGALTVRESCNPEDPASSNQAVLTCQRGLMLKLQRNSAQTPVEWTAIGSQTCEAGEMCQETLLLVDIGHRSLIVGSKGCSKIRTHESPTVTVHSGPPGMLVASYARFCSSSGCNRADSSSVLLDAIPRPAPPVPGDLQCPACVELFGSCSQNSDIVTCPKGTIRCYRGSINLKGGGLSSSLNLQGCMAQPSRYLLNHIRNIGVFSVMENSGYENEDGPFLQAGAAPTSYTALVVVLGLSLALSSGVPSLLTPFPLDSLPLLTP
uniref:UPAR/Ly6 domain-containing protein n=3 Tax=Equus TaxID=9789 RepID=F7C456_HORSE